jgi:hypothetical protein
MAILKALMEEEKRRKIVKFNKKASLKCLMELLLKQKLNEV